LHGHGDEALHGPLAFPSTTRIESDTVCMCSDTYTRDGS
jgi:hypothetical protein